MTASGSVPPAQGPIAGLTSAVPGAGTALLLLLAINLFNYIDRQILAAVEPEIRKELLPDESEADAKAKTGMLSSAFLIAYMLTAPIFGWLADRMSRWLLVGVGIVCWSLASGASGLNWGLGLAAAFWVLFITRCFVGIGEGAYGPVAPSMISDLYPEKQRGKVLSLFYLAIPVGGALGYAFGEVVKNALDWRWAFYLVVPPGLLLGALCFCMRDRGRQKDSAGQNIQAVNLSWRDYLAIWRIPSYRFNTLGMTAMTFAIGALAYWMPDYLEEEKVDDFAGIGPRTVFGIITALSGLVATILGGLAGDALRSRFPGSYFLVSGASMLLGMPMLLLFVVSPFPLAWLFAFLAVFCLFFNTGPTNTILANVTRSSVRASAFAMNILIIHALGDVISPPLIGYLSGHTSRKIGFVAVSVMMLVGGIFWLLGAKHLGHDTRAASSQ